MAVSPATEAAPLLLPGLLSAVKSIKQHIQKTHANKNQEEKKKSKQTKKPQTLQMHLLHEITSLGPSLQPWAGEAAAGPWGARQVRGGQWGCSLVVL